MRSSLFTSFGIILCVAGALAASQPTATSGAAVRYGGADVDAADQLHITTIAHHEIIPAALPSQVGFQDAAVSDDGTLVGWLALFPNNATSYPIPLRLVVLGHGRTREFTGSGLPIWQWCFADRDRQVVFEQETTHGGIGRHFEEWNIDAHTRTRAYRPDDGESREASSPPAWTTFTNQSGGECRFAPAPTRDAR
jgi:hypothetical protein